MRFRTALLIGLVISLATATPATATSWSLFIEDVSPRGLRWSPGAPDRILYDTHYHLLIAPLSGGDPIEVTDECAGTLLFAGDWTPDGQQVVYYTLHSPIGVVRCAAAAGADTGRVWLGVGQSPIPHYRFDRPRCSPDGTRIAISHDDAVYVFPNEYDGWSQRQLITSPGRNPCWSPDGAWLVFQGNPGDNHSELFLVPADGSAAPTRLTYEATGDCYEPDWSPDGEWIVYRNQWTSFGISHESLHAVYVGDGPTTYRTILDYDQLDGVGMPSFSPDGSRLVVQANGGIYIVDDFDLPVSGASAPRPVAATLHGATPNPFNAGTVVAFELTRPLAVDLRIYDVAGRLVRTLLSGAPRAEGAHDVTWHGRDDAGRPVVSGVYSCRLDAGGETTARTMVLVK